MNDRPVHPWHRVNLSITDRRMLRGIEQRLAHQHPDVSAGKVIRMVQGTARLLHTAGLAHEQLATQVEAACQEALTQDTTGDDSGDVLHDVIHAESVAPQDRKKGLNGLGNDGDEEHSKYWPKSSHGHSKDQIVVLEQPDE